MINNRQINHKSQQDQIFIAMIELFLVISAI